MIESCLFAYVLITFFIYIQNPYMKGAILNAFMWPVWLICLVLLAAIFIVYGFLTFTVVLISTILGVR